MRTSLEQVSITAHVLCIQLASRPRSLSAAPPVHRPLSPPSPLGSTAIFRLTSQSISQSHLGDPIGDMASKQDDPLTFTEVDEVGHPTATYIYSKSNSGRSTTGRIDVLVGGSVHCLSAWAHVFLWPAPSGCFFFFFCFVLFIPHNTIAVASTLYKDNC